MEDAADCRTVFLPPGLQIQPSCRGVPGVSTRAHDIPTQFRLNDRASVANYGPTPNQQRFGGSPHTE